jgi:ribosome-binding factor A
MHSSSTRTRRIAEQVRRELALQLQRNFVSPLLSRITFTAVKISADLSVARVYYTVLGAESEADKPLQQEAGDALRGITRELRHACAQSLRLRKSPQFTFVHDDSIAYGSRMDHLLRDLVQDNANDAPDSEDA